jgi:midasin
LTVVLNGTLPKEIEVLLSQRVLLSYYRIIHATPYLPESKSWSPALLLDVITSENADRGSKWLAIRSYSMQVHMSEAKREDMVKTVLGEGGVEDCPVYYGEDIFNVTKIEDGWLLPLLEEKRIQDYRIHLLEPYDYYTGDETYLRDEDLQCVALFFFFE